MQGVVVGSRRGSNAAIFGTNITTVQGGEGSRRWRLAEGQTWRFLAQILPQYEEVKGFGVGVSRRDKYRDFGHKYYHSTKR